MKKKNLTDKFPRKCVAMKKIKRRSVFASTKSSHTFCNKTVKYNSKFDHISHLLITGYHRNF